LERGIDMDGVALASATAIEGGIVCDLYARNEAQNTRIGEPGLRKLLDERVAVEQRDRRNVVAVHLRRDGVARLIRPANIHLALIAHANGHTGEIVGTQAAPSQIAHAVDNGVRAGTGGVRLEADEGGLPSRTEIQKHRIGGELSVQSAHEATEWRLYDIEAS